MKPSVVSPAIGPWPRLWTAVAVVTMLIAGAHASRGCGERPPAAASVTWTGSAYGVAWAKPGQGVVAIYAHRFAGRDFEGQLAVKGNRARQRVHRVGRLESPPEIVGNEDGFIVFIHSSERGDREPRLLAVPLDRHGRVSGSVEVAAVNVYALCKSPTWNGRTFSYAYTRRYVDGTRTSWRLITAQMDQQGQRISSKRWIVDSGMQCSIDQDGHGNIEFSHAGYGPEYGPFRLLRFGEQWAKLHLDNLDDRSLAIDMIDDAGKVVRTIPLPKHVDASTVDLGVNDSGLYVTWIRDGKLWVLPVTAAHEAVKHRISSKARGARTVGHDDRCAVAWTVNGGKAVRLAVAQGCR